MFWEQRVKLNDYVAIVQRSLLQIMLHAAEPNIGSIRAHSNALQAIHKNEISDGWVGVDKGK